MLNDYRKKIELIDLEIADLINKRMNLIKDIRGYKKVNHLNVEDKERENYLKTLVFGKVDKDNLDYFEKIYDLIFKLSKEIQK